MHAQGSLMSGEELLVQATGRPLDPEVFRRHLEAATRGNRDHPVVFYCRANCWMSWNAAKRALAYGYTSVYWFDDGVDGWLLEDYDFEILQPQPGLRQPETTGN